MSQPVGHPVHATGGGPLVPPPPPRGAGRRRKKSDPRWWIWPAALGLGIGLGVAAYQWAPKVDTTFDYWIALALS